MNRGTKYYRKNECAVMESLGLKPTKNSGAGWIEKEDGESEYCLCQLKSTDKQSISINQNDLHVLVKNADIVHKIPVFALQFLNINETWLCIRPQDLGMIKGIATADINFKKYIDFLRENFEKDVAKQNKACYNNISARAQENIKARGKYEEQKKKEREEKERGRKKWKKY